MAILLAYIFYFIAASVSPLQRRQLALRRETDKGQIDFAFRVMLITFVLSSILVLFRRPELNQPWLSVALLALAAGLFGALGIGSQYIAQRHVEAGLTTLLSNLYTPVTIILASSLLHERLKRMQLLGAAILLFSVFLVSNKHRLSRWRFDRFFLLMALSGVSLGIVLTAERALIKNNGITTGTWVSWGAQTLCLAVVAFIIGARSQYDFKDTTITGSFRFLQQLSWVVLITVAANLSLVASITTFKVVVIFVAAAIFLKERQDLKRKILGSIIAVAGLLLMA